MAVTIGRNYTISRFWSQHQNSTKSAVWTSWNCRSHNIFNLPFLSTCLRAHHHV